MVLRCCLCLAPSRYPFAPISMMLVRMFSSHKTTYRCRQVRESYLVVTFVLVEWCKSNRSYFARLLWPRAQFFSDFTITGRVRVGTGLTCWRPIPRLPPVAAKSPEPASSDRLRNQV